MRTHRHGGASGQLTGKEGREGARIRQAALREVAVAADALLHIHHTLTVLPSQIVLASRIAVSLRLGARVAGSDRGVAHPCQVYRPRLGVQVHEVVDDAALEKARDLVDDELPADVDQLDRRALVLPHRLVRDCSSPTMPHTDQALSTALALCAPASHRGSLLHKHTHTHTHTLTLSLTHTHSITHSLTHTNSHTHTHTLTHSHTHTHSLSLSLTHTHSLTHSLSLSHTHTLSLSAFSHSHSHNTRNRIHIHTHTTGIHAPSIYVHAHAHTRDAPS
jgi:hypothetical protein